MEQKQVELKKLYIREAIARILKWCAVAVAIFMVVTADLIVAFVFLVIALAFEVLRIRTTKSIDENGKLLGETATMEQLEAALRFFRIKVTIYRILTHGSIAAMILSLAITENFLIFMGFLIMALLFGVPAGRAIRKRDAIQNLLGKRFHQ